MRLTRFTDYSLRVMLHAATAPGGRTTIAQTARAFGISEHHLVKVVHMLGREGLLANTRGRGGGMRLALDPAEINVGRVVRAAEGASHVAECFEPGGDACVIAGSCHLSGVFREALEAFYAVLDRYTLQDLLDRSNGVTAILHRHEARKDAPGIEAATSPGI
jgi:Rrf2 family nitric oxide-sensitive transcriptional repressor